MKIHVEADSQEEFDLKRPDLVKALAGSKHEVVFKPSPKRSELPAQNQMVEYWDKKLNAMIKNLKKEIEEVLRGVVVKSDTTDSDQFQNGTDGIDRSAFIYMDPKGKDKKNFAQCKTCMMWTGPKGQTCTIHGKLKIKASASCALYVNGPNHDDMIGKEMKAVEPETSGLIDASVRCENCKWFDNGVCVLFQKLNEDTAWNLDEKVHAQGCCNAWESK